MEETKEIHKYAPDKKWKKQVLRVIIRNYAVIIIFHNCNYLFVEKTTTISRVLLCDVLP